MQSSAHDSNSIEYLTEVNRIQKLFQNKKGFVQVLGLLFAFPYVALGIGAFVLILLMMLWFMLGKILGAAIVILGLLSLTKLKWWQALIIVAIGILVFFNPFGWAKLQMMW